MWRTQIINTIQDIDENSWNSLAGGHPQLSHAWQRVLEAAAWAYQPEYVLLLDDAGLAAFAICPGVQSWQLANTWARRFMQTSTLLSSTPASTLYTGLAVRDNDADGRILQALLDALQNTARRHHRPFQALTNVNPLLPPSPNCPILHGFRALPLMAGTYLSVRWNNFVEYRQSLGRKHNQEVRSYRRRARQMGVTVTRSRQFAAHGEKLYRLMLNVHQRHYPPNTPHVVSLNVFEALERECPPGTEMILISVDDQIVAFGVYQFGQDFVNFGPWLGLDYEKSRDTYAYFMIYYEIIQAAMDYGCRGIYAGPGTYDIKSRLGFETLPRYLYIRGTNRWFDKPLTWLFSAWQRHHAPPSLAEEDI